MNKEVDIARLDGYLNGIASLSGDIRDYSASAFMIKACENEEQLSSALKDFFSPQATLCFSLIDRLECGIRDVEHQIRPYLVRNVFALDEDVVGREKVFDREKYLSFRVMDLISEIANSGVSRPTVFKLKGNCKESSSQVVFFCILYEGSVLVLQFNDDTGRGSSAEKNG